MNAEAKEICGRSLWSRVSVVFRCIEKWSVWISLAVSNLWGSCINQCVPFSGHISHSWDVYPDHIPSEEQEVFCYYSVHALFVLERKLGWRGREAAVLEFLGEKEGQRCLTKSHLVTLKSSTSARLLKKKIWYPLIHVQLHVVNLLWQVFTILFVCFMWICRRIMFDERDSVPNPCANMYLCQKYLHGDLESWDFSQLS